MMARALLFGTVLFFCLSACAEASDSPGVRRGWRAYPNPFTTRFRVEMPESITPLSNPEVDIRVFDMRGHRVRHWVYVVTGHEIVIDWNGRTESGNQAPSGWYIFEIRFKNVVLPSVRFRMLRIRGVPSSTYDWRSF